MSGQTGGSVQCAGRQAGRSDTPLRWHGRGRVL